MYLYHSMILGVVLLFHCTSSREFELEAEFPVYYILLGNTIDCSTTELPTPQKVLSK